MPTGIYDHSKRIGSHHTKETINKLKISCSKAHLGLHHSNETKKKLSTAKLGEKNPLFGKHHKDETKIKIGLGNSKEKNANWIDGRSKINNKRKNINGMQESHFVWCNANQIHRIPKGCVIHHIDCDWNNNSLNNLQLLEDRYHRSLHNYFFKLMKEGGIATAI